MHLNARSILPKMDEIRFLMNKTQVGACVFLKPGSIPVSMTLRLKWDNYSLIRKDQNRNRGRVCVFIRSDLHFSVRVDLINDEAEILMIDICLPKTKPILLGVCYQVILTPMSLRKLAPYSGYSRCCNMFGLTQLIKDPTRICKSTQSTIDLILVSDKENITQSGVIEYSLSDHFLIYCTRKLQRDTFNRHKTIKIWSFKHYLVDRENPNAGLVTSPRNYGYQPSLG